MLYGVHVNGKRFQEKPRLQFEDCVKLALKAFDMQDTNWENHAYHHYRWRKQVKDGVDSFEGARIQLKNLNVLIESTGLV